MPSLSIDFESRSAADLRAVGLDNYARHESTDVWCMSYAFDDEPVQLWTRGDPPPQAVLDHIRSGGVLRAFNAAFEYALLTHVMTPRYNWPAPRIEQMCCTMAMAYAMALPGSLEKAAAAVGIAQQKDMKGHHLMMQMCKPKSVDPLEWWDDPEKVQRLGQYCATDTEVERALFKRLMQLSPSEQDLWRLDHAINTRGITIDRKAVQAAMEVAQHEKERLTRRFQAVTKNFVGVPSEAARLTQWVNTRGVDTAGIAKADVVDLLARGSLPDDVREALTIRREYAKSSNAKLRAMLEAASAHDDRLRGMFQYHGAGTGRWAGRKVQLHNLPRPALEQPDIEAAVDYIASYPTAHAAAVLDNLYGSPLDVVSSCLRAMLVAAAGCDLMACDFSNIEGRVLAWLAGEEWKIQAFRGVDAGTGIDLYILTYAKTFGLDPTTITKKDPRRQVGKVEELAFGFGGGPGAWATMSRVYPDVPVMSLEEIERIKYGWRDGHPATVNYWSALERAARDALLHPGVLCSAGAAGREVRFKVSGSFLWCLLPSARVLCYPYARLDTAHEFATPTGRVVMSGRRLQKDGPPKGPDKEPLPCTRETRDVIFYMSVNGTTNKWEETHTYGGKLSENVTQAVARDVLADAMRRLDACGAKIVLHVHDEIVVEVPESVGEGALKGFEQIMAEVPEWARGLPIAVEGWRGKRYRK